jgi:Peptidase family M50
MSATPILDRELPAPRRRVRRWLGIAIGAPLGLVLAWASDHGFITVGLSPLEVIGAFVISLYGVVFVHELAHAIAGILCGFEVRGLSVGPFFLSKRARGWRIQFSPWMILGGGVTSVTPKSSEKLRARYICGVSAGPLATVLFIGVCLLHGGGFWWMMLLVANVIAGLTSFMPYTIGGQPTDAKIVWTLARGGPAADWLIAMLELLAFNARGVEPRDWPQEYVETIGTPVTRVYRPVFLAFQCELTADGPPEAAAEALERALEESNKTTPSTRRGFFVAAASFQGFVRRDAGRAREWLEEARKVRGAVSQKDWDSKAEAAILWADGHKEQATDLLKRYVELLDRQPTSGLITAERRRVVALQQQVGRARA